ncbi:MAG: hypothetical protein ACW98J_04580, partial [Candidatus Thorarchaeota archaeon]
MSPRQIIALCILMLLAAPPLAAVSGAPLNNTISRASIETTSTDPSSYIEHSDVLIRRDADFIEQGWEGNGSAFNPFVIENLNISLQGQTCILIYNITAHFVIRDSYLSTDGVIADNIQIISSRNGMVDN